MAPAGARVADAAAGSSAAVFTPARASRSEIGHESGDVCRIEQEVRVTAKLEHVLGRRLRSQRCELRFGPCDLRREALRQLCVDLANSPRRLAPLAARAVRLRSKLLLRRKKIAA